MIRTLGRMGDPLEALPRRPRLEEFETSEAYRSARWVASATLPLTRVEPSKLTDMPERHRPYRAKATRIFLCRRFSPQRFKAVAATGKCAAQPIFQQIFASPRVDLHPDACLQCNTVASIGLTQRSARL
ncbi:hypothetical protein [Roseixanthobacter glucoisosaccharinicivorans]|uniref:hypothetical protein n=1 Tax=Roseixanthobacter glucoisosaccharinicivorans TaxID=3119923 RepID=UPI00372C3380